MSNNEAKRLYMKKWRLENKEHIKEYNREYKAENKQEIKKQLELYKKKDPAKYRKMSTAYHKKYRYKNKETYPIVAKKNRQKWRKANQGKANALAAKYRAKKLQATPKWLTQAQLNEIAEIYILAQELSWLSEEPLQVDHIMPLQGKNSCGLHVPWNLQILPKSMNCSKHNKEL
jgi:hypothetical protein